jgi:hypothetical protein
MKVLKDFVHSFDFVHMSPRRAVVEAPAGVAVEALVEPGKQYAVYLYVPIPDPPSKDEGAKKAAAAPAAPRPEGPVEIGLDLPAGRYRAEWVEPRTGEVLRSVSLDHAGGRAALVSPPLAEDLALAVRGQ